MSKRQPLMINRRIHLLRKACATQSEGDGSQSYARQPKRPNGNAGRSLATPSELERRLIAFRSLRPRNFPITPGSEARTNQALCFSMSVKAKRFNSLLENPKCRFHLRRQRRSPLTSLPQVFAPLSFGPDLAHFQR